MPPANRKNPVRAKSSQSLYSVHEFRRDFPDDEACLQWLWRERYSPDGENAYCPKCETARVFKRYETKQQRQSWTCTGCGHHLHPTAGTIFHKSSRPLTDWFYVMFLVASTRCGISAKQVERELGCNYKTAWRMLNLVRNRLMAQDYLGQLGGKVEADETFVGGKPREVHYRIMREQGIEPKSPESRAWHAARKQTVFAAVERKGRVRAQVVPSSKAHVVRGKVGEFVLPSSIVYTDDYKGYDNIGFQRRYVHRRIQHHARIYVDGDTHTQTVEGFFSLVKNGIRGVYHSVSAKWLQGYVNEYVWRYNHRDDDEAMFKRLIVSSAMTR